MGPKVNIETTDIFFFGHVPMCERDKSNSQALIDDVRLEIFKYEIR